MLVSMTYLRWSMSRMVRAARVGAVVVLAVFLYVSLLLPGIVATGLLAAVLLVLVVMEKRWPRFATWGGTQLASTEGQRMEVIGTALDDRGLARIQFLQGGKVVADQDLLASGAQYVHDRPATARRLP